MGNVRWPCRRLFDARKYDGACEKDNQQAYHGRSVRQPLLSNRHTCRGLMHFTVGEFVGPQDPFLPDMCRKCVSAAAHNVLHVFQSSVSRSCIVDGHQCVATFVGISTLAGTKELAKKICWNKVCSMLYIVA